LSAGPFGSAPRRAVGRHRVAVDDLCDLVERHREHVVQHEGEAFRRRERLQDDQQGQADGVGDQRLLFGVGLDVLGGDHRFR
jgi:hypothetical protein